jgi:hypothetical protein
MVDPTNLPWRSPLGRSIPVESQWIALGDARIAQCIQQGETIGALPIVDLSPLPRLASKEAERFRR